MTHRKHKHRQGWWDTLIEPDIPRVGAPSVIGALGTIAAAALQPKPAKVQHAPRHKFLVADKASTCFDRLTYSPSLGGVFATFTDGTNYFYPMDREEAQEWFDDPSLGKYFNAIVR